MKQVEVMLKALMKHQGLIQWITGWAPAENEGGVSVLLYGRYGRYHICKVYSEQFSKLPQYVRDEIPASAGPAPKDRDAAQRAGIYRECRPFQIARFQYPGDEEKKRWRFEGVLAVSRTTQEQPVTAVAQPDPASPPVKQNGQPDGFDWWKEAASCADALMFDSAVVKAEPWFSGDTGNAQKFREAVIGPWIPANARATARAMYRYAAQRQAGDDHVAAKRAALNEYNKALA